MARVSPSFPESLSMINAFHLTIIHLKTVKRKGCDTELTSYDIGL